MSDPYVGHITMFSGTYVPAGYAECNGQYLTIVGNEALYSVVGTQFGGDGITNFALPDFRGRIPVGVGDGPGLDPIDYGQRAGVEAVTLQPNQMPAHTHLLAASKNGATTGTPGGNLFSVMDASATERAYHGSPADLTANPVTIGSTGSSQSHTNLMPYMVVRFIIALKGVYPTRS